MGGIERRKVFNDNRDRDVGKCGWEADKGVKVICQLADLAGFPGRGAGYVTGQAVGYAFQRGVRIGKVHNYRLID